MIVQKHYIWKSRDFSWFELLLALAIIIIFGYLFCMPHACY